MIVTAAIVPEVRSGRAQTRPLLRNRITAAVVVFGGVTVIIGTLLPWMTLLGGLHTYRGVIGLYGRLLAGGGVSSAILGLALARRDNRVLRLAAGVLGGAMFFFSLMLLRNMIATIGELRGRPMLLAAPGGGLYVCVAGAAIICASVVMSTMARCQAQ